MKRTRWPVAAAVLAVLASARGAGAQEAGVTLSGAPQPLSAATAVAGLRPDPVRDESTVYGVTAVATSDLVGQLDAPLPPGMVLRVRAEPPPGAVSVGMVELTTAPRALVRSIPPGTHTALRITYELVVEVTAGVVPPSTRQVSLTVVPVN